MDELVLDNPEVGAPRHSSPASPNGSSSSREDRDDWLPLETLKAHVEKFGDMIVQSARMRQLVNVINLVAPHKGTVLIQGESGTGKELVASALHTFGPSPKGPLVIFNCSNLLGSLAEAQLFGHVRGAFTDAREDSLGYFRSANGGTLFLDEIGELPLALQPKLLRAVEMHEVQPVGSTKSYKVDARLVAATNRDLTAMVKSGDFRQDLYYRFNMINLRIPPLRERRDGIRALTVHFIEYSEKLFDKRIRFISRSALERLLRWDWPGNVRELANVIQSAVMLTREDRLGIEDFALLGQENPGVREVGPSMNGVISREVDVALPPTESGSLKQISDLAIKDVLLRTLNETGGNCARTARALGVSRFTIYRLIERHRLVRRRGVRGKHFFNDDD
jgi:transcriptional regulator with GAF, ATPase, and Fis domain